MKLNFLLIFNFYCKEIEKKLILDIQLGNIISDSNLYSNIKGKTHLQRIQITKDFFLEKYKYIKAIDYEIKRMLNSNCYDNKSINLIYKNSLNMNLIKNIKDNINSIVEEIKRIHNKINYKKNIKIHFNNYLYELNIWKKMKTEHYLENLFNKVF